jgi:hypothetical protein
MGENASQIPVHRRVAVKRIAGSIAILLISVVSLAGGFLLYVRVGLQGERLARLVTSRLEIACGARISFVSAQLQWLDAEKGRLVLNGLRVCNRSHCAAILEIPNVLVEFRTLPILRGRLALTRVAAASPTFYLDQSCLPGQSQPSSGLNLPISPVVGLCEIDHGRVVSAVGNKKSSAVLVENLKLTAKKITMMGVEDLAVQADLPAAKQSGALSFSGKYHSVGHGKTLGQGTVSLTDVPFSTGDFLLRRYCDLELPFTDGRLNLKLRVGGKSNNWQMEGAASFDDGKLASGRIFSAAAPLEHCAVSLKADYSGTKAHVESLEGRFPGISLSLKGDVVNMWSDAPNLALNLNNADLDLEKLFPIIPLNLLKADDRDRLIDAGLRGRVLITGGAWSGPIQDLLSKRAGGALVFIDAYLDRISGFIPGAALPLTDATGRLRLSSEELLFKGISFTLGNSPIVLNGWVTDLKGDPKSDLFLSLTAQAQDLKPILESGILPSSLSGWINLMSEQQGGLSVNLDVKGALKHPSMKGRIALDDFHCKINGLPLPIRKVSGSLRFRSSGISSSAVKGLIGDSPFEISGEMFPDNINLNVESKLAAGDIKKLNIIPQNSSIVGTVPVFCLLKGSLQGLHFSTKLDMKNNAVEWSRWIKKKAGVPFGIEFSGARTPRSVSLDDFYLLLDDTRVSGKATFNGEGKIVVSINLPPKGIPSSVLIPYLDQSLEPQSGGRVEGDVSLRSSVDRFPESYIEANIVLNHVSLKVPGIHKRTEGLTGTYKRRGNQTLINVERAKIGSSMLAANLSIDQGDRPKMDVDLDFSFLDTTDFTTPPHKITDTTWGEWLNASSVVRFMAKCKGGGSLKAAKGKTSVHSFSDFKATFEGNSGIINCPGWQMNIADGIVTGAAVFNIKENTTKPFSLTFQADKLKVDRLLNSSEGQMKIEGELSSTGRMGWAISPGRANHGVVRTGSMDVRILDGTIHRFEILSKIFSLLNLGSLLRGRLPDIIANGLPFQKGAWTMEVFDNKWKIKDFKLNSDAARIDATGMYFSSQNRVDFKVDVSPLVGLDTLMSGLFGNLITKDGKTLTTTFRVRGLYGSPDVRLEPFESFKPEESQK